MFAQCLEINVNIGVLPEALKFPVVKRREEQKRDFQSIMFASPPNVNAHILAPVLDEKGGKASVVRYE